VTLQALLELDQGGAHMRDNADMLPLHVACSQLVLENIRVLLEMDIFTILEARGDGRTALQLAFDFTGFILQHK